MEIKLKLQNIDSKLSLKVQTDVQSYIHFHSPACKIQFFSPDQEFFLGTIERSPPEPMAAVEVLSVSSALKNFIDEGILR